MRSLSVPDFSPIEHVFMFYGEFCEVCEMKKEKNEEIKTNFCSLVSWKWLKRFSSNVVCRP